MCEECEQLAQQITRYRKFTQQALDPLTQERIKALVKELEQRKTAMHQGGRG
jgi:TATA-binding protein-associated factor Taf7